MASQNRGQVRILAPTTPRPDAGSAELDGTIVPSPAQPDTGSARADSVSVVDAGARPLPGKSGSSDSFSLLASPASSAPSAPADTLPAAASGPRNASSATGGVAAAQPQVSAPAGVVQGTPGTQPVPSQASNAPLSGAGMIRPMALSPSPLAVDSTNAAHTIGGHGGRLAPLASGGGSGGSGGGQSGGSGGSPLPPSVYVSGPGITTNPQGQLLGVVGGQVNVSVTPGAPTQQSGPIVDVVYSVTGALSGQNYSWAKGESPATSGQTVPPVQVNGVTVIPDYNFLEDNTTGNHSITVTVDYQNVSAGAVVNVNVLQPAVTSFQGVYEPFTIGQYGPNGTNYGLSLGDGYLKPGISFTALVSNSVPFSGQFALIQLTQVDRSVTAFNPNENQNITYNQESHGSVLDNPYYFTGDPSVVTYAAYTTTMIGPNTIASVPDATYEQASTVQGVLVDSPSLGYLVVNNNPVITSWVDMSVNDSFQTYLAYRSNGGAWIGLSKISWSIFGSVDNTAQGWVPLPPLPGQPPTNPSPNGGGTYNGDGQTALIGWSNSVYPSVPNNQIPGVGTFWQPTAPPLN